MRAHLLSGRLHRCVHFILCPFLFASLVSGQRHFRILRVVAVFGEPRHGHRGLRRFEDHGGHLQAQTHHMRRLRIPSGMGLRRHARGGRLLWRGALNGHGPREWPRGGGGGAKPVCMQRRGDVHHAQELARAQGRRDFLPQAFEGSR